MEQFKILFYNINPLMIAYEYLINLRPPSGKYLREIYVGPKGDKRVYINLVNEKKDYK